MIIYSDTLEDHWIHVNLVLERLILYVIKVKLSKCKIAQTRIEYLSHIIENGTIRPSPRKTQALFQHKTPTTVNQLHKMHGLAAYYKRFVRHFSDIARPIREAINECIQQKVKNIVNWNDQRQAAYDTIRELLTNEPILRLPQFDKPFQVETDASDYGCGGVLTQEHDGIWHPIAYFSQSFTGAQTRYSTSEKELYAIVLSCEYFRQFLYGLQSFNVITDHMPLRGLLTRQEPSPRLARWITRLEQFTGMNIVYRSGKLNTVADALSRICNETSHDINDPDKGPTFINTIATINDTDTQTTCTNFTHDENHKIEQQTDKTIAWIIKLMQQARQSNKAHIDLDTKQLNSDEKSLYRQWERLHIIDGILFRQWTDTETNQAHFQYVVPQHKRLEILQKAHDDKTAGHLGSSKTIDRVKSRFYWPKWEPEVKQYVQSCPKCQKLKSHNRINAAPLQPIISHYPYQIVTFDMTGPLCKTKGGYERIMVIVDHFSKYIDLYAIKTLEAIEAARCLLKSIWKHGIPDQIISDQGTNFQSKVVKELCNLLDIQQAKTTAYHPQADGLSERAIRTIKPMLATYVQNNAKGDWNKYLDVIAFAYNTAVHATTKYTPFYLMYGRKPKTPLDLFTAKPSPNFNLTTDDYANTTNKC